MPIVTANAAAKNAERKEMALAIEKKVHSCQAHKKINAITAYSQAKAGPATTRPYSCHEHVIVTSPEKCAPFDKKVREDETDSRFRIYELPAKAPAKL